MIVLGKTHTVEFAMGGYGTNAELGTPWNPWDLRVHRTPGGSSSGSGVAVAAGLAPVAVGTDTGGSVRLPASFCGIVGLKVTVGRISTHGVLPLSTTLDTPGPMTRSVEDAAILFRALAGRGPPRSADAARAARRSHAVAAPRGGGPAPRRPAGLRARRDRRRGPRRLRSGDRGARAPRRAARAGPATADVPGLLRRSRPDLRARGLSRGRRARRGLHAPARPQRPRAHPPGPRGDGARLPRDAPPAGRGPARLRGGDGRARRGPHADDPDARTPAGRGWTRRSPRRTSPAWRTTWGSAPSRCRTG